MQFSTLLAKRQKLLEQARLANVAFAYARLGEFHARVARAGLRGRLTLKPAAPQLERYWAMLVAHDASQAVVDEHFSDEEVMELADVVAFAHGRSADDPTETTFRVEDIAEEFLAPLRTELERAGVSLERAGSRVEEQNQT